MTHTSATTPFGLNQPTPDLIDRLARIVGPGNALTTPDMQAGYLREWRDRYIGATPVVLRPGSTAEVAEILKLANEARVGVVPQAGNTGLVGGQIPFEAGNEIVLSVSRLNAVRSVDAAGGSITVEAGVTLANVQNAAEDAGMLFPLSLAAEGTCQIGGNLATNAGGVGVLAYGGARDVTLGLEVVTADGRIWNGLSALKKDNTGYDLRNLFVGSEGTLGIITAAVLKLFPRPVETATAFAALNGLDEIAKLFDLAKSRAGPALTAFEFVPRIAIDLLTRHIEGIRDPLSEPAPWYVLLEVSSGQPDGTALSSVESLLEVAFEDGAVLDATIAASDSQRAALWRLREEMSDVQKLEGGSIKHDVSVPVSLIPTFISRANHLVEQQCPGARPVPFGHFGDGNVHYNVSQPPGMDREAFLGLWEPMSETVHGLVAELGGSFSAEHGVGRMKRDELRRRKDPVALEMMHAIKAALDPNGILNPGKVL